MSLVLRIAALVLFVLAALAAWAISSWNVEDAVGLVAAGLGSWVASTLPIPSSA